ncbi:MAG: hypothetical protein K9L30_02410 [Desulfobacterales bacterium]|nr:hypothetical protein [Desulfobacterales bacterium]
MAFTWSDIQRNRLWELDAEDSEISMAFDSVGDRDRVYQKLESKLIKAHRKRLRFFREETRRPTHCILEDTLVSTLVKNDFSQVSTPIIMAKGLLSRMGINETHPLSSQVFWVDSKKCLRPMLAPHLYFVLKDLLRLFEKPVRIFEIGPCFRKETQGGRHANEFTMLNITEFGLPEEQRHDRLMELISIVTKAAGIKNYKIEAETSEVYGETIDVVSTEGDIELASGAMGPHPLDQAWKITDTWVGVGFGIERLLMVRENSRNLARMGRSLTYLDGVRLNI